MTVHSTQIIKQALDLIRYSEASSVTANNLTTILTFTATARIEISLITCSGQDYAKFQIFVDTVLKGTKRSGPARNVEWNFSNPLILENGSILDIKVTHWFTGDALDFEAGMYALTST